MPLTHVDEKDNSNYAMVIKFDRYYLEFLGENLSVQLPELFAKQHGDDVSFLVNLCDPVGNESQVIVKKVNGRPYFSTGWNEMGSRYLQNGRGTVRLVYIRPDKFFIKVKDRFGKEVDYPTPPCIFKLAKDPVPRATIDAGDKYLMAISEVPTVYHTLSKRLAHADTHGGRLSIPADFCHMIIPAGVHEVKLIDSSGYGWRCELNNDQEDVSLCGLHSGWAVFRHIKLLFEGTYIKLGVRSTEPTIILFEFKRPI